MKAAFDDGWAKLYTGTALDVIGQMPEKSVHMCVTSPPYFGLRSYLSSEHPAKGQEIGTEKTPDEFVAKLVEVFAEVHRVLRDDGTCWVNIGDSYAAGGTGGYSAASTLSGYTSENTKGRAHNATATTRKPPPGLKPKDLMMIPARLALALQAWGWYLRSEITWIKPNPMPESVTDRPTSATEKVYLLSKKPRYFYDAEAVKEAGSENSHGSPNVNPGRKQRAMGSNQTGYLGKWGAEDAARGRNMRNYWQITTKPYPGSHFATFPPELPMKAIRAGTSEYGVCSGCGAPWKRVVEHKNAESGRKPGSSEYSQRDARFARGGAFEGAESQTLGWVPTCSHDADTVPATVLDPFAGSGTTLYAARKLGRRSIGIDLDERSSVLSEERLGHQGVLL